MKFGISKCATLIIERGIISGGEGIQLPNIKMERDINT